MVRPGPALTGGAFQGQQGHDQVINRPAHRQIQAIALDLGLDYVLTQLKSSKQHMWLGRRHMPIW